MNFEGFLNNNEEDKPRPKSSRRKRLNNAMFGAFAVGVGIGYLDKDKNQNEEVIDEPARYREESITEIPRTREFREFTGDFQIIEKEDDEAETESVDNDREVISAFEFKSIKPEIKYREINPELPIENLNLLCEEGRFGAETVEGKILRTLRYQNITAAVEERYNLPPGILMSMIMKESTEVDLLPNALGDGGFGLSHMQASRAREYKLRTYLGCNSLVCNGKRGCKNENGFVNHAAQLKKFMEENRDNREALVEADERLNILLNIDAAGRMLANGIAGNRIKGLDAFETAICRYSGKDNFPQYWKSIIENMRLLTSDEEIDNIRENFNFANENLTIDGSPANFDDYMKYYAGLNENYGLEEYRNLPKYNPENSMEVLDNYKELIK